MKHGESLVAVLAFALLACAGARAAPGLDTPACKVSRAQLEIATAAALKARESGAGTAEATRVLRDARERTAQACFGQRSDSATGTRTPPPEPPAGPGSAGPAAGALQARPTPALASPSLSLRQSSAVNLCDDTGCWDSNGQRLNRLGPGPVLTGPRGPCTVEAGVANCP